MSGPMDLTVSDATHKLTCSHCIGKARTHYTMPCIPLKVMKGARLKILVFGDRNWADKGHIKRIRYVSKFRVKPYVRTLDNQ